MTIGLTGMHMGQSKEYKTLASTSEKASARIEAQKQWNTNPCGALPTASYDRLYFERVEADRYRQQYWQKDYFDYWSFRGRRVLEIGVGLGTDLKQFSRNGADCFGVDITDMHLQLTQKNFETEGFEVHLHKADAISLPFHGNYFDCVYSFGVLHHIPDVEMVLAEAKRVLKPGGLLQVAVYHRYSFHALALLGRAMATGKLFRLGVAGVLATMEKGADGDKIKPYVRLYSRHELSQLITDCGFKEIRTAIRQVNFDRYKVLNCLRPFESLLGWYVCAQSRKPMD
jgi:ubiquinone/menaquinone biosynthesis C-methylase UbiE